MFPIALLDTMQRKELVKVSKCWTQELAVSHELLSGAIAEKAGTLR